MNKLYWRQEIGAHFLCGECDKPVPEKKAWFYNDKWFHYDCLPQTRKNEVKAVPAQQQ